jgi:hypothetical protein
MDSVCHEAFVSTQHYENAVDNCVNLFKSTDVSEIALHQQGSDISETPVDLTACRGCQREKILLNFGWFCRSVFRENIFSQ